MRGFYLPIMIGCYDEADKCSVIAKDPKHGGYSLFVCYLKKRVQRGEKLTESNVGKVICHLHFCKLSAAKVFLSVLQEMVDKWEAENDAAMAEMEDGLEGD